MNPSTRHKRMVDALDRTPGDGILVLQASDEPGSMLATRMHRPVRLIGADPGHGGDGIKGALCVAAVGNACIIQASSAESGAEEPS